MSNVGYATLQIIPSMKDAGTAITQGTQTAASKAGDQAGKTMGSKMRSGLLAPLKGAGGAIAVALGGAAVVGFFKDALGEAREGQKVGAITEATIKATGGAAKITADQVGDLATSISNKTGMDDEAIQSGANLLLTFKNVRNEVGEGANIFDRATAAAADLSAAGFGDLSGTSKQLGKALNDPIKGIAALSKSGVTFTASQEAMIKGMVKSGNVLGAQKIILAEVEAQVGGVAEAQATAGEKAAVAWGNVKEQIGTLLIPIVDKLANVFTTKVVPAISGFIKGMQDGTGAGGEFAEKAKAIGSAIAAAVGFIVKYRDVLIPLAGIFLTIAAAVKAYTIVQGILNLVMLANPVGLIIIAIAALVGIIVVIATKTQFFQTIWKASWSAIQKAAAAVWSWLKSTWPTILAILSAPITNAKNLITKAWSIISAGAKAVLNAVVSAFVAVVNFFKGLPGKISSALGNAVTFLVTKGRQFIQGLLNGIVGAAVGVWNWWNKLNSTIASKIGNAAGALVQKGRDLLNGLRRGVDAGASGIWSFFSSLPRNIVSRVGSLAGLLSGAGADLARGFINGIGSMVGAAANKARELASAAKNAITGLLDINSPSRVADDLGRFFGLGFSNGMESQIRRITGSAMKLARAAIPAASRSLAGSARLEARPQPATTSTPGSGRNVSVTVLADDPNATARKVGRFLANQGV